MFHSLYPSTHKFCYKASLCSTSCTNHNPQVTEFVHALQRLISNVSFFPPLTSSFGFHHTAFTGSKISNITQTVHYATATFVHQVTTHNACHEITTHNPLAQCTWLDIGISFTSLIITFTFLGTLNPLDYISPHEFILAFSNLSAINLHASVSKAVQPKNVWKMLHVLWQKRRGFGSDPWCTQVYHKLHNF